MLFMPSITTLIGSVALSAAVFGVGGFLKGTSYEKGKAEVALAKAVDKAREREEAWRSDAATIEGVHDEELRRIAAQHVRDLAGLRRAANRLPETATCAADGSGATGRQLSQPDAQFLVGLAAAADATAADLRSCQSWVKSVTEP